MADIRDKIENRIGALAFVLATRKWAALAILVVIFGVFASGVPKITVDTSTESFLHSDDPVLSQYNAFKDQFGREDIIIIAIEPDELFSLDALLKLREFHADIEENVPNVDEITSMINARNTYGEEDRLIVDDLMADWPDTEADVAGLKARVMSNPLYLDQLISRDGQATTLVITLDAYSSVAEVSEADVLQGFDDFESDSVATKPGDYLTDAETRAAVAAVQTVVERHNGADFRLQVAGVPMVTDALKEAIQKDMRTFMGMAFVAVGICLFLMFRRASGVVLPFAVVVLSLISTMGLMGHAGVAVKVPTVILPSFVLAISVGASVHILAIFYQALQNKFGRLEAIGHAFEHSGLAIVLTSLTTAVALGSFATAEVAPIADLGIFAGAGALLSLFYTVFLLPPLLAVFPVKARGGRAQRTWFDGILHWFADVSTTRPKTIVAICLTALVVSLAGVSQLRFSHDMLAWLPSKWPVSQATRNIDHTLRGSVVVEVVIDTGRENGLYDPEILSQLDELAVAVSSYDVDGLFVGKIFSVVDILKEIHQALNENRPEFYAIPENSALIPQEFLLFENAGADDLENAVDSRFQIARFSIRVPWRDTLEYVPFLRAMDAHSNRVFAPEITIQKTGIMSLFSRTLDAAIRSAAKSYLIAFFAIALMMVLLLGSLRLGLLSMFPNLTPIIVVVGAMYWLSIPLNLFTMLVGSIAIGLAVDDTVHFMHNFRRYYLQTGDLRLAVQETLHTTGRAMLVTSIVLAAGFYIFTFATLNNVIHFGILTGSAILLALISNFLMLPALLSLIENQLTEELS